MLNRSSMIEFLYMLLPILWQQSSGRKMLLTNASVKNLGIRATQPYQNKDVFSEFAENLQCRI